MPNKKQLFPKAFAPKPRRLMGRAFKRTDVWVATLDKLREMTTATGKTQVELLGLAVDRLHDEFMLDNTLSDVLL